MPATAVERATGRANVPPQDQNRQDAEIRRERDQMAEKVYEFHRKGLQRKRYRDLTAEKYLLHIDGEGDSQWADILHGQHVAIPPNLNGVPRQQHNMLRPMVQNFVAHHTTMPIRLAVEARPDRESREQAMVDQALMNYVVSEQDWNTLFAEAMFLAAPYGHCPVHATWRDDLSSDPYEPIFSEKGNLAEKLAGKLGLPVQQVEAQLTDLMPRKGMVDCWVGDPWDTVYNAGATKNSVQVKSYGRVLPADMVRQAFSHVPEAETLEGNDRMPSASRFQRTAAKWLQEGMDVHGSATLYAGEGDEELVALIFRETAPGVLPNYPGGRLQIVGLQGAASTDEADARGGTKGEPRLLHDGPLPGGTFSSVEVYAAHRGDDIHGKPYVADLDDLQVKLNQLESLWVETVKRATRPPFVNASGMDEDTMQFEADAVIDIEPGMDRIQPDFIEYPTSHLSSLQGAIERTEAAMFRIGGWQAASRGEADSGDSGRKVIALAKADDTIHGPINQQLKRTQEEYAGVCWRLFKEFADVPHVIDVAGEEMSHLAEPYIDRTKLSDKPPQFRVTSGMGATPESEIEQLINLMQVQDPETGEPLLSAEEVRQRWPDNRTFRSRNTADQVRERRPRVINTKIREAVEGIAEQLPVDLEDRPVRAPAVQRLAQMILVRLDRKYPMMRDDDLEAHLDALSQITQEETEHPLTRAVAMLRQDLYFEWAAEQQQAQMEQRARMEEAGQGGGGSGERAAASAADAGGTTTSRSLELASGDQSMQ